MADSGVELKSCDLKFSAQEWVQSKCVCVCMYACTYMPVPDEEEEQKGK